MHIVILTKHWFTIIANICSTAILGAGIVKSVDGLEFFGQFQCYPTEQPRCKENFVDVYPEVSMSHNNASKATTSFYLFTSENPDVPELLHKCAGTTPPDSKFNSNKRTEIIVPGYISGICIMAIFRELKNELLKKGDRNIILVDWTWGNTGDFIEAARNTKIVARQIAIVIKNLKEKYGIDHLGFVCTGHSFGAQICGFVGQNEHINIINGLDPAGITFSGRTPPDERLDRTDADCVQVIHTNGGLCLPNYIGINITCGTVDFWVNGGLHQESCRTETLYAFLKGDYLYGLYSLFPPSCSHFQALQYYKYSINEENCQYVGVKCQSYEQFQNGSCRTCGKYGKKCLKMGVNACDCLSDNQKSSVKNRNYYLDTDVSCPYCNNSKINLNGFSCSGTP